MPEPTPTPADYSFHDYNNESSHLSPDCDTFSSPEYQQHCQGEGEEGGFAADFYRSGTDWSCLVREDMDSSCGDCKAACNSNRKMKQANLLQMWGLNKKPRLLQDASFSSLGHTPNPKITHPHPNPKPSSTNSANRPRICPFYKKIPGFICVSPFRYLCTIYIHMINK